MSRHPTDRGPGVPAPSNRAPPESSGIEVDDERTAIDEPPKPPGQPDRPRPVLPTQRSTGEQRAMRSPQRSTGEQRAMRSPQRSTGEQRAMRSPQRSTGEQRAMRSPQRSTGEQRAMGVLPGRQVRASVAARPPFEDSGRVLLDPVVEEEPTIRADTSQLRPGATIDPPALDNRAAAARDIAAPRMPRSARASSPGAARPAPAAAPRSPHDAAPHPSQAAGRLVIVAGNDEGRTIELDGRRVSVGRGLDNDVVLTDIAVSRKHLRLEFDGARYRLVDMGSGNGTLINDRLETSSCLLRHGDRLELGNTFIHFEHPASQGAAVAAWPGGEPASHDAPFPFPDGLSTTAGRASVEPAPSWPEPQSSSVTAARPDPWSSPSEPRRSDELPSLPRPYGDEPLTPAAQVSPGLPPQAMSIAPQAMSIAPQAMSIAPSAAAVTMPPEMLPAPQRYGSAATSLPGDPGIYGSTMPVKAFPPLVQTKPRPARPWIVGGLIALLGLALAAVAVVVMRGADDSRPATESDPVSQKSGQTPDEQAGRDLASPGMTGGQPAPLPAATWGTDETALVRGAVRGAGEATVEPPADETEPAAAEHGETDEPPEPEPGPQSELPKSSTKSAAGATASAARKRAFAQYRAKRFEAAAEILREAAAGAPDAAGLRTLAAGYEKVGADLDRGNKTRSSNPIASMAAHRRALSSDKKFGEGVHQAFIRSQLAIVSPKAASAHMAKNRYEEAKDAADMAASFGAGSDPAVRQVRSALERKAEELYKSSLRLSNKPAEASALLRRILEIVPPDSPWYGKAYKRLNARKSARN